LARYKVDIAALDETRFSEQGQLEEVGAGYTFFWSVWPKAERRDAGVAFAPRMDIVGRLPCRPQGIYYRLISLRLPLREIWALLRRPANLQEVDTNLSSLLALILSPIVLCFVDATVRLYSPVRDPYAASCAPPEARALIGCRVCARVRACVSGSIGLWHTQLDAASTLHPLGGWAAAAVRQEEATVTFFLCVDGQTNAGGHYNHAFFVASSLVSVFSALLAQCFHMPWLLDEPRPDGFTPLHLAVLYSHLDVVDALLVAGANVNAESAILLSGASVALGSRLTPLHLAVQKAHTTITCLLLAHGANACARDAADKRPIDLILPLLAPTARPRTAETGLTSPLSNSNTSPIQAGGCILHLPQPLLYKAPASEEGCFGGVSPKVHASHNDCGVELSMIPFLASVARFLITSANSVSSSRPAPGSHLEGASPLRKRIESIVQTTLNSGTPATVLIAACLAAAMGLERQKRADFERQRQDQQQETQPTQSLPSLLTDNEAISGSEDPFHTRVFSSLGNPVIELALQQCYLEACLSNSATTNTPHQSPTDPSVYPQFVSRSPDVDPASSATALNDFFASATTTDNRACDRIVGDNLLQSGTGSPTGSSMSIANFLMPSDWSADVSSTVASTSNPTSLAPATEKNNQQSRVTSILPLNLKDVSEELRECLVCSIADRAALLIPCGHVVACQNCTQLLKKCITCRQPITGYREIPACRECTFRPAVTFTRECNHFLVCRECIMPRLTRLTRAMVAGDGITTLAKPEWQESEAFLATILGFFEEDEGSDQSDEMVKRQQLLLAMFNAGELCPDGACPECGQGVTAIWSLEMACCQSDLRSTLSITMSAAPSRGDSVEAAVGGATSSDLTEALLVPITVTQNSTVWLARENNQVLHTSAISSPQCVSPRSRQSSIRNTTSRPPLPRCTQAGGSNARPNNMHPSVASTGRSTPSLSRSAEEQATSRELKRLQHELQAMREQTRCPICLDRSRNLVFMCGHATCQWCGDQVAVCPICRRAVTGRIVLY
uniref:ANK_REP_REGION domain-containing protein n=1 Tax=Schistocephalus solidus TaxID=70667 RepID=A0A183SIL2_SCHSO